MDHKVNKLVMVFPFAPEPKSNLFVVINPDHASDLN
jgi:hypothetical protein